MCVQFYLLFSVSYYKKLLVISIWIAFTFMKECNLNTNNQYTLFYYKLLIER